MLEILEKSTRGYGESVGKEGSGWEDSTVSTSTEQILTE